MASKASLLNFVLLVMTYLLQVAIAKRDLHFRRCLAPISIGQLPERGQFIRCDVGPILLRKEVGVDPVSAALGKNDRAVHVVIQSLLEHTTAQIIGLLQHDLLNRSAQRMIINPSLPGRLGEPGCLENSGPWLR